MFDLFKNDTPQNKSIFILGNGPSLKDFDFTRLSHSSTLGMNAAYRYWENHNWYPSYYCCLDTVVLASHQEHVTRLIRNNKFQRYFLRDSFFEKTDLKAGTNIDTLEQLFKKSRYPFSKSKYFRSKDQSMITTGAYAVRYAAYLGYKIIYLLGIDLKYVEVLPEAQQKDNGLELVITRDPEENPNYFFNEYQQKGDRYHIPNPKEHFDGQLHLRSFELLRDEMRPYPIKIINCSQNSMLAENNIFEYRNIDDILTNTPL